MTYWKAHERRVAAKLGGTRTGNMGKATPDITADWLVAECKARRQLPSWLKNALKQVLQHTDGERLAIVVLHEHGANSNDDLVVMRLQDFAEWFGDG